MQDRGQLNVFVSSTSEDLEDYRAVAADIVLAMGWRPEMMEHWGASARPTVEECLNRLDQCDFMLLLAAFRQGWVPTPEEGGNGNNSITKIELEHARQKHLPVLALLARETTWPGGLWERTQEARDWVEAFRNDLKRTPVEFFDREPPGRGAADLPLFRARVQRTLLDYKATLPAARDSLPDYFGPAWDGLLTGKTIPFVGMGIYGTGPLSSAALVRALRQHEPLQEHSLATMAEFRERLMGSREEFLIRFGKILEEQSALVEADPIHELLSAVPRPPFIVDATFDRTLETRLAAAGKRCVTLSHIIRSLDGQSDGWILVMRPGQAPALENSDNIEIDESEYKIYRPLGSPAFNDAYPERELDTVVVTETDHLTLLRHLNKAGAGIPQTLIKSFKRNPLLFLGYGLDVWQYRLVVQVLGSVGDRRPGAVTRAVRVPEGHLEELAWKRLNADVIPMEPAAFAKRALQTPGEPNGTAGHAIA